LEPLFRQATKQVPVEALTQAAEKFGTPVYVTDLSVLRECADEVRRAFPDPWIRQFSVKANDVPAIIREVAACGFGANVVSRGEWALASEARLRNERITLEGVGKSDEDLEAAVQASVRGTPLQWIAVESAEETGMLAELAKNARLPAGAGIDVLLRLNPQVEPETSPDLAVGRASSKFGMTADEVEGAMRADRSNGLLRWRGLHLHVGSQLEALHAWQSAVRRALSVFAQWRHRVASFDTLDIGGGFPVGIPNGLCPADFAAAFGEALQEIKVDDRPPRLAIEPGRFLTASAGYLVARVLHARDKRGAGRQPLVVIDAGMTELIRPALYGATHPMIALTTVDPSREDLDLKETVVEGPICESTDQLGTHQLPPLRRGDLVAILETGAYASSMSSRYNGRPRPAEVLLDAEGRLTLGRPRSHAGLWQRL
jgi:diaminopimelate decarboxylase